MKRIIRDSLIVLGIALAGIVLLKCSQTKKGVIVEPASSEQVLLSGFEDQKVWGIPPEKGFSLKLNKKYVTEGKTSLEVVYPKGDLPSINTRKLDSSWGKYEYFAFDVYNPQDETLNFTIRLDDTNKKRINIKYPLRPGWNKVKIPPSQISAKIDAANVAFVVLFLNEPKKKYKLYFDNMRLEKSGLIEGIEYIKPQSSEKKAGAIPVRKAVPLPEAAVQPQGELELLLVKLKKVSGDKPLVSAGIPFAPGQLKSEKEFVILDGNGKPMELAARVLARWPQDNSVRSVLVQFRYPIQEIYEKAKLKWGETRKTKDLPIVDPLWDYPEGFILLSKEWLCQSRVIGEQLPMGTDAFQKYDAKLEGKFGTVRDIPLTGNLTQDGFYSTPHVFYQFYVRSGDLKYFLAARKELLHYREAQIIHEGKDRGRSTAGNKPRYVYVQAMADDYFLTGDPRSLEVAGHMAEYLRDVFPPKKGFYPKDSTKFWTERQAGFPFLGIVTYYEMTGDKEYLKLADEYMDNLYKTQMQWPSRGGFIHNLYAHDPEEGARQDEYGGSPFMTGLLLEGVVKYHRLTGSEKAADSIFRAADWLINEGLASNGKAFIYMTADKYRNSPGEPDVSPLIVHALGYAYKLSGYQESKYFDVGQAAFNYAVEKAYVGKRKHFNQSYRSSGHYLAYVWDAVKNLDPKQLDEPQKITKNIDGILLFEGFDYSTGNVKGGTDSVLKLEKDVVYLNGNSLHVQSRYIGSNMSAGLSTEGWVLEKYPLLSFVYKIPNGTPVGMRVRTSFDQWVCLGGTPAYTCEGYPVQTPFKLEDDDRWHEVDINVRDIIKQKLAGVRQLKAFEFSTFGN
ncbi:MAG: hypothetical protein KC618_03685, partial [Candidatus Omnitrophica bacterium]|nr:hypothetical protein [Candidatus Omnitrophota bacterium]